MKSPVIDYLDDLLERTRPLDGGQPADYIPDIKHADIKTFGIALTTVDGRSYAVGNTDVEFTLQSMSKPFAYAAALSLHGEEVLNEKVGMEPSGEAFNELSLEEGSNRPDNPLINVGALAVHSLILEPHNSREDRVEYLRDFFSRLAGRELSIDGQIFQSEIDTAERNLAMGHMLKGLGIIDLEAHDVVAGYVAQCAVKVNICDVAVMGATLANGGVQPITGEQVMDADVARKVLSVMVSAGMYNASGIWFAEVGISAKSGVSGSIVGALPSQLGVAAFSPNLDEQGNSVRGIKIFRELSQSMGLHVMNSEPYSYQAVRSSKREGSTLTLQLQGKSGFLQC